MRRERSPKGRVRDDDFIFGYVRIVESSLYWRKQFRYFLWYLDLRISWQAQYLVMLEGLFTAKKWFGHCAGRSPCAHSIGKFFLCYIVLFSSETSAPGSPGNYLYINMVFGCKLLEAFFRHGQRPSKATPAFQKGIRSGISCRCLRVALLSGGLSQLLALHKLKPRMRPHHWTMPTIERVEQKHTSKRTFMDMCHTSHICCANPWVFFFRCSLRTPTRGWSWNTTPRRRIKGSNPMKALWVVRK